MEKEDSRLMENPNGKITFALILGLFLFLWMGYFGGYFVATNEAMDALKAREAKWESKSKSFQSRERGLSEELAHLKISFNDQERELNELRLQIEKLKRELSQAQTAVQTVKQPLLSKISQLEVTGTMQLAELREAHLLLAKQRIVPTDSFQMQSPLTIKQIVAAKNAFNDIQHEVAAGNFKGLSITNGYQCLRAIFDNPELDQVIGLYDTAKGAGR